MSLSLDYITMPPKSQEASQIQTQEITRMEQENQQLATQYQAEIKHHSEQTIRRNKAENEELKNDEKKKQQKKQQKRKPSSEEKKKEKEKKPDTAAMDQRQHFDMRI